MKIIPLDFSPFGKLEKYFTCKCGQNVERIAKKHEFRHLVPPFARYILIQILATNTFLIFPENENLNMFLIFLKTFGSFSLYFQSKQDLKKI